MLIFLGVSYDGTCLSWIEFIFDLSMWASILVYIFEFIIEAMMMIFHTFMLWYDTIYDDNACDKFDARIYNIMYMHTIVWWCSPMHYDVYLMLMMHKRCTLRWWGCIFDDEDAYPMTMIHTLWRWCIPMMMMRDDACLMFNESRAELLFQKLCMMRCTMMCTWADWLAWPSILMSRKEWPAVMSKVDVQRYLSSGDEQQLWAAMISSSVEKQWWADWLEIDEKIDQRLMSSVD